MNKKFVFAIASLLLIGSQAALAKKADGVLRIAFSDPIEGVDEIFDPKPETDFTGAAVFNRLISYNPDTRSFSGELASQVTQIDPLTWEFKLKPGITFHDGSPFGADDVVYTIGMLANPDIKFRLKTRFSFLKRAEKIDDLTVRIVMNEPYVPALARFATSLPIYPRARHGALKNPSTWGKSPIGTGPYKVISVDSSAGIVLERYDNYKVGPLPSIAKIEIRPVPDSLSQLAEMMVGNIDLVAAKSSDVVSAASATPGLKMTSTEGLNFIYISLDAEGKSGKRQLTDPRVRQAIFKAIDRNALRTAVIAAGESAAPLTRICFPNQVACPDGGNPPATDIAMAKALLAEAGYPNGFDVEITAFDGVRKAAEAIAGYLRAIGIKASVDSQTMSGYRRKQTDGKLQILLQEYTHGGLPDAGYALAFFFGGDDRDYTGDATLRKLTEAANTEIDPEKRAHLIREAYDRMDSQFYLMPISANPTVFVHTPEVVLDATYNAGLLKTYGASILNFKWRE